ncbi:MAG: PEP-CTERM sorting domain-containing protein [Thermoguttaceae bacterium]
MLRRLWLLTLSLTLLGAQAASATMIANGGFESGSFSDWTVVKGSTNNSYVNVRAYLPHSGTYEATFAATGDDDDAIWQTVTTTAGQWYSFDFWLKHDTTDPDNDFSAKWDGNTVLDLVNAGGFGWTEYQYTVRASSSATTVQFSGRDPLAYYRLDDVSVTPVPEPSALALLAVLGVAASTLLRRQSQS